MVKHKSNLSQKTHQLPGATVLDQFQFVWELLGLQYRGVRWEHILLLRNFSNYIRLFSTNSRTLATLSFDGTFLPLLEFRRSAHALWTSIGDG